MIDAVIFDWGGTLTPWRSMDFDAEARALAEAAVPPYDADVAAGIRVAGDAIWARSRDEHRSATLADIFAHAGLTLDESRLAAYRKFWEPATLIDPDVPALFAGLREAGVKVGVLSNTVWPREWHEEYFVRDGVLELIDGAVYSSEIPWTKPHPEAFRAAMAAVGAPEPDRCVFVGDRPFEDVYGARQAGMRAVLVPHSEIPDWQRGHTDGEPDAVVHRLAELLDLVRRWRSPDGHASPNSPS
ncbi:MAG: HAD family hydrolase [Micromonosporaceae bacterium]